MAYLLEFIFQGFLEWVYSLVLEIWNYFASSLLGIMTLDFAYIKTHVSVIGEITQILLAVGWALLLGNLVFQALRGMASGLGFEGEDPKLLFARTFVFSFLLLASPQICETVLQITSHVITLLQLPDAIQVHLVDDSTFGTLTAAWVLVIIFDLITMFMVLSLLLEVAERYMVLAVLTITAPLAFAMGGSKSTSEIFTGWCRMFGSMCLLMATNIVFFKMLLSVVSAIPSGLDVFPWMVLITSIVKVAKRADEIITRIGLNPALTGNRSSLPGMLAYTVFRTAVAAVTKNVGAAVGGTGKAAAGAAFGGMAGKSKPGENSRGRRNDVRGQWGSQMSNGPGKPPRQNQSQSTFNQQEHTQSQRSASNSQTEERQNFSDRITQQQATNQSNSPQPQTSRKTGVPSGAWRSPSRINPDTATPRTQNVPFGKPAGRQVQSTTIGQTVPPVSGAASTTASRSKTEIHSTVQQEAQQAPVQGRVAHQGTSRTVHPSSAGPANKAPQSVSVQQETRQTSIQDKGALRGTSQTIYPSSASPTSGAPQSSAVQQRMRQTSVKDRATLQGGGQKIRPASSGPATGAPQSSSVRQETRQTSIKDRATLQGDGQKIHSASPSPATGAPQSSSVQQETRQTSVKDRAGFQGGGPRIPPTLSSPASGAPQSSPVRQETRQTRKTDKPLLNGGAPAPQPGPAGTVSNHRPPAVQKHNVQDTKTNPARQVQRKGGGKRG